MLLSQIFNKVKSIRKNKKAFTLIEIIAVIVIIGIVLLIVSIPVTKYVENSKAKTYESHEKELAVATKNYMIECLSDNDKACDMPSSSEAVILTYEDLVKAGYSKELEDPDSDGYCDRSYVITEKNGLNDSDIEYKSCLICSQYKTKEEWCVVENLTCEIEVVGTEVNGWYKTGVQVILKYDTGKVNSFGMNSDFTNVEYNGVTNIEIIEDGITNVFGYVKDNKGNKATCEKEIKIDKSKPEGTLYMGYQVYPKENSTLSNNVLTINDLTKYGVISGVVVEFKSNLTSTASGNIKSGNNTIKTNGSFVEGRDKAIFEVTPGTYDNIIIDFGNSSIKDAVSTVRVLKEENETSVWTNKDVMLYVDANDSITGVQEYSYNNEISYETSNMKKFSSNTSGTVVLKDVYGNTSVGYDYDITKIDKVVPILNLNHSVDETTDGSLYISKISYDGYDTFGEVEKIEYLESSNKTIPNANEIGDSLTINSYKSYASSTSNKYVFFRIVDEAGNKSTWQRSNRYIGNKVTTNYDGKINTGTIGDTYTLKVSKCSDSSCNDNLKSVSLSNNSFYLTNYNYGNGIYKFEIASSDNDIDISRVAYLHRLTSVNDSHISEYASDSSISLNNVRYIRDNTCSYVSVSKNNNNRLVITAYGNYYDWSYYNTGECEYGTYDYNSRNCVSCPNGEYDSSTGTCKYCEYGSYDGGSCISNYGSGQNNYTCAWDSNTNELRWVYVGSTYNVVCPEGTTKEYTCGESDNGEPCSVEGDTSFAPCTGWCVSSQSSISPNYYGPIYNEEYYYSYTIGIFLK